MNEAERILGRRTAVGTSEGGIKVRVFAPAGPDGEPGVSMRDGEPALAWPFVGHYYCCGEPGPRERWYTVQQVGICPDGEVWLSWERCSPPVGHEGERVDLLDDPPTLPVYTDNEPDTLPGVCPL